METSRYIIKRILLAAVSLFAIITITYFLMNLMPGDPFMSRKSFRRKQSHPDRQIRTGSASLCTVWKVPAESAAWRYGYQLRSSERTCSAGYYF